jgi:hypothetical protein
LQLIKEDLSLTHKGRKLAENFVNTKIYDKLVLCAMNEEREGLARFFGFHASLDGTMNDDFLLSHQDEITLLKEYILDHPKNNAVITYIYENSHAGNAMNIVEQISLQSAQSYVGKKVILGFKTILAFEELAIIEDTEWVPSAKVY